MSSITVVQTEEVIRVGPTGPMDDDIGSQLVELTQIALGVSSSVVIDVSAVTGWTRGGLEALFTCADLGAELPLRASMETGSS